LKKIIGLRIAILRDMGEAAVIVVVEASCTSLIQITVDCFIGQWQQPLLTRQHNNKY
jgi:hypothetical protein